MHSKLSLGAREVRANFADIFGRVHYGGETVIVERSDKPMVAVISIDLNERLMSEREVRFAVVDRLQAKGARFPEEEFLNDIAEANAAVRAARH